jgi:RecJ-like exonuclease
MTKKLFLSLVILLFVMANAAIGQTEKMKAKVDVPEVKIAEFKGMAEKMVGKTVEVQGMVTHVCKHGGKKMFLMASDPDVQVKITTGENVSAFPIELEGNTVWVKGKVEEMMVEVEEEEHEEHEMDEAHKNIYHKPQYSIACKEYKVTKK